MFSKILLCFLFCTQTVPVYANDTEYYARIMYDDVYLYREPVNIEDQNIYFSLPRTYFVQLIDSCNETFYEVNYAGINGYVKKECVQTIAEIPVTPYLDNLNFRIYAEASRDMRTEPTTLGGSKTQIAYIPLYSRNLTYLGSVHGQSVIDGRTDIWYYCKFTSDKDYYGYVYSDFCDELPTTLPQNTEQVTYITPPKFTDEPETATALSPESKTTAIIVVILTIPSLVFVYFIFKNKSILLKGKTTRGEVIDY